MKTEVKILGFFFRNYIKIDHGHCIIKYNKYMAGGGGGGLYVVKIRTGSNDINAVSVLKSAAFKVFKLVNPDTKIDFAAFTRWVARRTS